MKRGLISDSVSDETAEAGAGGQQHYCKEKSFVGEGEIDRRPVVVCWDSGNRLWTGLIEFDSCEMWSTWVKEMLLFPEVDNGFHLMM